MSKATFEINSLVYSDLQATNNPQLIDFSYKKSISVSDIDKVSSQQLELPSGNNTITIPSSVATNWIYLETDQPIVLRFSGDSGNTVAVSPSSNGTSDGLFFKRGSFTSLVINVLGSTPANVVIMMGV